MKVHHQFFTFFHIKNWWIIALLCTDCICTENFRIVLLKNILNCKFSRQRYIKYDLVWSYFNSFFVSFHFNLLCSCNVNNTYERDKVVRKKNGGKLWNCTAFLKSKIKIHKIFYFFRMFSKTSALHNSTVLTLA